MHLKRLCFIFLMNLLFLNSKEREGRNFRPLSSYTRLLALTQAKIELCHICLLEKVGVEDIILVANNTYTRVYLIKGPSTFMELFVLQCNNGTNFCTLQTNLKKFPPYSAILLQSYVLEYSISLFSMHMDYVISDAAHDSDTELSFLKSYGGGCFFLLRWYTNNAPYPKLRVEKRNEPGKKEYDQCCNNVFL